MNQPILRLVHEHDLQSIADIYNYEVANGTATFDTDPKTVEDIRAWLFTQNTQRPTVVALVNDQVVGFAGLYSYSPRKAYDGTVENTLYLHQTFRGMGIGKILLADIIDRGQKLNLHSIIARISADNGISLKMHSKLKFAHVGTLKEVGNKFGRLLNVEILQFIYP